MSRLYFIAVIALEVGGKGLIQFPHFCPPEGPQWGLNPNSKTLKALFLMVMHTKFGQNWARTLEK